MADPGSPTPTTVKIALATEFEWAKDGALTILSVTTDTISERTANAGVTIDGLKIENDGTTTDLLGTAGDYIRIGDAGTTAHTLNSEDDLMVTGELEVKGDVFLDGDLEVAGHIGVAGSTPQTYAAFFYSETISSPSENRTGFQLTLSVVGNVSDKVIKGNLGYVTQGSTTNTHSGQIFGGWFVARKSGSQNMTSGVSAPGLVGVMGDAYHTSAQGTITAAAAFHANQWGTEDSGGTVTDAFGLLITSPMVTGNTTNAYGIYINDITGADTLAYGIYIAGADTAAICIASADPLQLGVAGASTGTMNIQGATSGVVTVTVAAAAGTWTMTLPTGVGGAGDQLTDAGGNGVTSWAAAASLREYKDIISLANPKDALDLILNTKAYHFNYKEGMGTLDNKTDYVGVMADEAPWAMHYGGRIVNPVNTLGYMVLGFQAMDEKIESVNEKIDRLESELAELKASL